MAVPVLAPTEDTKIHENSLDATHPISIFENLEKTGKFHGGSAQVLALFSLVRCAQKPRYSRVIAMVLSKTAEKISRNIELSVCALEERRMLATFPVDGVAFSTIQAAVDAAAANPGADVVAIPAGSFFENVNISDAGPLTIKGVGSNASGTILDAGGGIGIQIQNSADVTIKLLTVRNGSNGVFAANSTNLTVVESAMESNSANGLYVDGATSVDIRDSRSINNTLDGWLLMDSANNLVVRSRAFGNGNDGLDVGSVNSTVSEVIVKGGSYSDNGDDGLELVGSTVRVTGTTTDNNFEDGVQVVGSDLATLTRVIATNNLEEGVELLSVVNAQVVNSTVGQNGDATGEDGVAIRNSDFARILGGTINSNFDDGIDLDNVATAVVKNATIQSNGNDGLATSDVDTLSVIKTTVIGNLGDGLEALGAPGASSDRLTVTRSNFISNGGDGLNADQYLTVKLTDTNANSNSNHGFKLTNIKTTILNNSSALSNGLDGLSIRLPLAASLTRISGGMFSLNADDGIHIEMVSTVRLTGVTGASNLDDGLEVIGASAVSLGASMFFDNFSDDVSIF